MTLEQYLEQMRRVSMGQSAQGPLSGLTSGLSGALQGAVQPAAPAPRPALPMQPAVPPPPPFSGLVGPLGQQAPWQSVGQVGMGQTPLPAAPQAPTADFNVKAEKPLGDGSITSTPAPGGFPLGQVLGGAGALGAGIGGIAMLADSMRRGPSEAEAMLAQQNAKAQRQAVAMGAADRSGNPTLALRNAGQAGIAASTDMANQMSVLRAQEEERRKQAQRQMGGAVLSAAGAGLGMLMSDEHVKEQIQRDPAAVQRMMDSLRPLSFRYTPEAGGGPRQAGVVAQDVASTPVGRQMVAETPRGLALDPVRAVGPTLGALGDLHSRVSALEGRRTAEGRSPATLSPMPPRGRLEDITGQRQVDPLDEAAHRGLNPLFQRDQAPGRVMRYTLPQDLPPEGSPENPMTFSPAEADVGSPGPQGQQLPTYSGRSIPEPQGPAQRVAPPPAGRQERYAMTQPGPGPAQHIQFPPMQVTAQAPAPPPAQVQPMYYPPTGQAPFRQVSPEESAQVQRDIQTSLASGPLGGTLAAMSPPDQFYTDMMARVRNGTATPQEVAYVTRRQNIRARYGVK